MRRIRSQEKGDMDDAFYTGFEDVDTTKDKGKDTNIPIRTKSSDSLLKATSISQPIMIVVKVLHKLDDDTCHKRKY